MSNLTRIHHLKTIILALIALGLGIGLLALANYADHTATLDWLAYWPVAELGSILAGAGLLGIGYNYLVDRDKDAVDEERTRRLLRESAPDFRDAVVRGFAVSPRDLKRVATPELLDSIAKNVLSLRLGDDTFASELYEGVRDQAIRAPERWYDAQVRIRLSNHQPGTDAPNNPKKRTSPAGEGYDNTVVPQYSVLVQWEYTVVPISPVRRFACTSDRDEFYDLITDSPVTSAWFLSPALGIKASDQTAFELLQFTVNGEDKKIRRSERKTGQTYTVNLGDGVGRNGEAIRIGHTYRTINTKSGHLLSITVAQPTRNLKITLDYTDTDIAAVTTSDLVSSANRARITTSPSGVAAREVTIDAPGWLLPPNDITYVWTLNGEEAEPASSEVRALAARPREV